LMEEVKKYKEQEESRIQKPDSGLIIPGRWFDRTIPQLPKNIEIDRWAY
jgi:hypothetical protein